MLKEAKGLHRKARPEITAVAFKSWEAIHPVPIELPERNGGTKGDQILAQGKRSFLTQSPTNSAWLSWEGILDHTQLKGVSQDNAKQTSSLGEQCWTW